VYQLSLSGIKDVWILDLDDERHPFNAITLALSQVSYFAPLALIAARWPTGTLASRFVSGGLRPAASE
jgi:hypothetical protein